MVRLLPLLLLSPAIAMAALPEVRAARCPNDGIQPQAAVDSAGKVHLVYLKGADAEADVYYTTSADGGKTWAKAIRVNSHPGSAIAAGTVRGAHLAVGKNDRPHVAWMGSKVAEPRGPGGATPMLYARLNNAGDAFEPQRNVITTAVGLDGGGSIAADKDGVVVAWHAPVPGQKGEENRTIWAAGSQDEGRTFAPEFRLSDQPTGACGCCGMRAMLDRSGNFAALYRGAAPDTRDMYLLHLRGGAGNKFVATKLHEFPAKTCPMSTMAFARAADGGTLAAWETGGQVYFAHFDPRSREVGERVAAPGKGPNRKHPSLAVDAAGNVLLAWSEGTGWKKGGSLAWQVYDKGLAPLPETKGEAKGLPVWSLPAAIACPDGSFLIVY